MFIFILALVVTGATPLLGGLPLDLRVETGPVILLGDDIEDARPGPFLNCGLYVRRALGIEQGMSLGFLQGGSKGDTLYRYLDLMIRGAWDVPFKPIQPFLIGYAGVSRWWVLKGGSVVRFRWGDRYQGYSFLLGGGIGLRFPLTKRDKLEVSLLGRFLFSQNQERFGIDDENEGSLTISLGYRRQLLR